MSCQLLIYLFAAASDRDGLPRRALFLVPADAVGATGAARPAGHRTYRVGSQDQNGLNNTRTTLAVFPIRLPMWNMPFHAEHHLFPSVPFYRLPALHLTTMTGLAYVAPGYVATNSAIIRSF